MKMNDKLKNNETKLLFEAILSIQNIEECADFFDDLCTVNEIKTMAQRLAVAKLLKAKLPYTDIVKQTGSSTATITRVNRCLQYGSDGYVKILERVSR